MKLYRKMGQEKEFLFEGTEKECNKFIVDDYTSRGEKSYYWRSWIDEDGAKVIDYGSWTIFYFLVD